MRVARTIAFFWKPIDGVYVLPTVRAVLMAALCLTPGALITAVPGAVIPVPTIYLLVSPLSVT